MSGFSAPKLLSKADNSGGASAQVVPPQFDPEALLLVNIRIAGYSGASVARLQFNGDTGTTAYSYSVSENFAAPTTAVAGAAAGINCAVTTGVARGEISFWIRNSSLNEHGLWFHGGSGSIVAATAPVIVTGAGLWVPSSPAAITRIVLDVGSGGGTLNAGAEISIYGVS